jgi:hypothetical protein
MTAFALWRPIAPWRLFLAVPVSYHILPSRPVLDIGADVSSADVGSADESSSPRRDGVWRDAVCYDEEH